MYEDLIDRAKEKEEKEAKKRKRLAKDFTDKLSTIKVMRCALGGGRWYYCFFYLLLSARFFQKLAKSVILIYIILGNKCAIHMGGMQTTSRGKLGVQVNFSEVITKWLNLF